MYACMDLCMYACMDVYMHTCMNVCMCTCTYICTDIAPYYVGKHLCTNNFMCVYSHTFYLEELLYLWH